MALVGNIILYIIMASAVIGAFASIRDSFRDDQSELGQEFISGIYSIGPIFLPVAGIMAATPYISQFVAAVFGPVYSAVGADPAMAATTFIAVDMGGYQLADVLAQTRESWIMAMITGYMAGATIVFSIPVGLSMLDRKDHKYMALGVMSGLLTIPIGVFISSAILSLSNAQVREIISTDADATYQLALSFGQIFANLIPLIIICVALALGLHFIPDAMIKGFMLFGRVMDSLIKLIVVFAIVEYFTGFFSKLLGGWGFNPIIADTEDQFRALEIAGYIGIMLSGAFPMVYLIKKFLAKPLEALGKTFGFSAIGSAGVLAGAANILALFRIIKDMPAADKVKCISFAVCSAFLLGDHLAFTANFQPTMIVPVMAGKFIAGLIAILFAIKLSVPKAIQLEKLELAASENIEAVSAAAE